MLSMNLPNLSRTIDYGILMPRVDFSKNLRNLLNFSMPIKFKIHFKNASENIKQKLNEIR